MNLNLSFTLPDDLTAAEIAEYIRRNADNAAGQIEMYIIDVPRVDQEVWIDFSADDDAYSTLLFRSE